MGLLDGPLGRDTVDGGDLKEGIEAFALFGGPDASVNSVALAEVEPPDLRGAHIDVIGAGEVVVLLATEEAEAFLVNVEAALAELFDLCAVEGAGDGKDEVGPPEALRLHEPELPGDGGQILGGTPLHAAEGEFIPIGLVRFEDAGFTANEERLSHSVPLGGCTRVRGQACSN